MVVVIDQTNPHHSLYHTRNLTVPTIFSSSAEETETKESKGRLLLIIVKGEHIKEDGGKHSMCIEHSRLGKALPTLAFPSSKAFSPDLAREPVHIFWIP